jgi:hypothetical protein
MSEQLSSGRATRSGTVRAIFVVLEVLVAYAIVGLIAGFVWEAVWTPPAQTVQQHQIFYDDYASLRRGFTGTGLYVVVAVIASAVTALLVALLSRGRELLMLVAVLLGSALAAAVMWKVGIARGPSDPTAIMKTAADGTKVSGNLVVSGRTPYVAWPMTSLFVTALVFMGWSGGRSSPAARGPADQPESETTVSTARSD